MRHHRPRTTGPPDQPGTGSSSQLARPRHQPIRYAATCTSCPRTGPARPPPPRSPATTAPHGPPHGSTNAYPLAARSPSLAVAECSPPGQQVDTHPATTPPSATATWSQTPASRSGSSSNPANPTPASSSAPTAPTSTPPQAYSSAGVKTTWASPSQTLEPSPKLRKRRRRTPSMSSTGSERSCKARPPRHAPGPRPRQNLTRGT